jgi:hypothetical protein
MTISEIKNRTQENAPHFFTRKTLSFFGQTMRSFKQSKQADGRTKIFAPMVDRFTGQKMGLTVRYFNPETNELDRA